jgi:chemotaxis protein MotB
MSADDHVPEPGVQPAEHAASAHEADAGAAAHAHEAGHKHKHKHKHDEASFGPGAPLWMLSFADMMTNLLCFFILLSAFAQKQEGVLLEDGLGSIQRALLSVGLPGAMEGRTNPVQFNAGRVVHRSAASVNTKTLVEADGRILDANRDALRQVIAETLARRGVATLPLPLLFEAGSSDLSPGHRAFLDEVAKYLASGRFSIRIDGYAFEEGNEDPASGWSVSEARARAARDYCVGAGIAESRITWVGHGLLEYGRATRIDSAPNVQNRFGRRAVLITFLE